MKFVSLHPRDVEAQGAVGNQRSFSPRVRAEVWLQGPLRYGAEMGISPPDGDGNAVGVAALLELPELQRVTG